MYNENSKIEELKRNIYSEIDILNSRSDSKTNYNYSELYLKQIPSILEWAKNMKRFASQDLRKMNIGKRANFTNPQLKNILQYSNELILLIKETIKGRNKAIWELLSEKNSTLGNIFSNCIISSIQTDSNSQFEATQIDAYNEIVDYAIIECPIEIYSLIKNLDLNDENLIIQAISAFKPIYRYEIRVNPDIEISDEQKEVLLDIKARIKKKQKKQADSEIKIGDFSRIEKLGEGATSEVFLVEKLNIIEDFPFKDKNFALKQIRETMNIDFDRVNREMKILPKIKHPNIVKIYYANFSKIPYFYLCEYVKGENLFDWRESNGISPENFRKIITKLINVIDFIHKKGVFHRDIKPQNIIINDEKIVVCDFGVAKSKDCEDLTRTTQFLGTIRYSAPEYLFDNKFTQYSEYYALGTVIYYLIFGEDFISEKIQFSRQVVEVRDKHFERKPIEFFKFPYFYLIQWIIDRELDKESAKRITDSNILLNLIELIDMERDFYLKLVELLDNNLIGKNLKPEDIIMKINDEQLRESTIGIKLNDLNKLFQEKFSSSPKLISEINEMFKKPTNLINEIKIYLSLIDVDEKLEWVKNRDLAIENLPFFWIIVHFEEDAKLQKKITYLYDVQKEHIDNFWGAMMENGDYGNPEYYSKNFSSINLLKNDCLVYITNKD